MNRSRSSRRGAGPHGGLRPEPRQAGAGPSLTAAVCTHERPDRLRRALRSLEAQDVQPDQLLVIDNAPRTERTREVVEEARIGAEATSGAPAEYRVEPTRGLDFARNLALHAARGEIVAFLDDDAVAHPDWVRRTRRAFAESPRLTLCMGRVEALPPLTPGARLFEANGGFARGPAPIRLPGDARWRPLIACSIGVGSGCSMAVRRETALDLGGFDEALDTGNGLPGGDLDLIWRALAAGGEVLYEPQVRALHEHRSDPRAVVNQIADHHRGLVAMLVKAFGRASGRDRLPILVFLGWRLAKPGTRVLRGAFGRDPLPLDALFHIWGSCWAGLGAYGAARAEVTRLRRAVHARSGSDPHHPLEEKSLG